jgi:PKD repeat protein
MSLSLLARRFGILIFSGMFVLYGATLLVSVAHAQETSEDAPVETVEPTTPEPLTANAGEDRNVIVNRTVLFDASATTGPKDVEYTYSWDFGDGVSGRGIDATHVYSSRGTYRARLTVTIGSGDQEQKSSDEVIVSVQDRLIALITDQSVPQKEVKQWQDYALTQGVLIVTIRDTEGNQEYVSAQNIAQQILKKEQDIAASDVIITWTAGNVGLDALIELSRIASVNNTSLESLRLGSKAVVAIQNDSLVSSARLAQTVFQSIHPQYIIVSDVNILDDVIQTAQPDELEHSLANVDADYQIVTAYTARGLQNLSPLNFISYTMNTMINRGVPVNSLYLILMLPIMATIIAAARQLVGIKAFGIFAPTVIALSFLSLGIRYGVVVFFVIITVGMTARLLMKRFRLLYLPRMALVLSFLALAMFAMFFVAAQFNKTGFLSVAIFPILIMTVLTEHFISVQIEQGFGTAFKLTLETLALSIIGYLIGDWTFFKTIMLAYPELILIVFPLNYMLGKFSGLRLTEYIRFRKVFKNIRHVEKS